MLITVLAVVACMPSSKISREEEKRDEILHTGSERRDA